MEAVRIQQAAAKELAVSLVIRARAVTTVSDSRRAGDTYSPALFGGEAQR